MYDALDISQAREFVDTKQGGLEFQIEQGEETFPEVKTENDDCAHWFGNRRS